MIEEFKKILKESEGKTPLDFPDVYDADSFADPKPLEIGDKICKIEGIDSDLVPIKDIFEFGKAHIQNVYSFQNKDSSIKQIVGYDISAVPLSELKSFYDKWNTNKEDPLENTQEDTVKRNEQFKNIVKEAGAIAYPKYPAEGSTVWEGRVALLDILLVFNNFEASSLGKSFKS